MYIHQTTTNTTDPYVFAWCNGKWSSLLISNSFLSVEERDVEPLHIQTEEVVIFDPHPSLHQRESEVLGNTEGIPLTSIMMLTLDLLSTGLQSAVEFIASRVIEAARGNMNASSTPPHTRTNSRAIDTYTHLQQVCHQCSYSGGPGDSPSPAWLQSLVGVRNESHKFLSLTCTHTLTLSFCSAISRSPRGNLPAPRHVGHSTPPEVKSRSPGRQEPAEARDPALEGAE